MTGGQRAVGTGNLVDVAKILEYEPRLLGQPYSQLVGRQVVGVDERQSRLVSLVGGRRYQVFGNGLQRVSREVWIALALGYLEAAQQVVNLLAVDVGIGSLGQNTTRADVVEIV